MKTACVIGWPIAQSRSPAIHNAAFEALGLDWRYVPVAVRPGAIEDGMRLLDELEVAGANVTMPHKRAVIPFMSALSPVARTLDAVNTLVRGDGGWEGDNTDGPGFLRAIGALGWSGGTALILGAGGAARAVAYALAQDGALVTVVARRPEAAADVAGLHASITSGDWGSPGRADLVVNATPSREVPIERLSLGPGVLVVDLITAPPETPLVERARAAGAAATDGIGMLVHQAALSFERWTGVVPPLEVMERAARRP